MIFKYHTLSNNLNNQELQKIVKETIHYSQVVNHFKQVKVSDMIGQQIVIKYLLMTIARVQKKRTEIFYL